MQVLVETPRRLAVVRRLLWSSSQADRSGCLHWSCPVDVLSAEVASSCACLPAYLPAHPSMAEWMVTYLTNGDPIARYGWASPVTDRSLSYTPREIFPANLHGRQTVILAQDSGSRLSTWISLTPPPSASPRPCLISPLVLLVLANHK